MKKYKICDYSSKVLIKIRLKKIIEDNKKR